MKKSLVIIVAFTAIFLTIIIGVYVGRNSAGNIHTIDIQNTGRDVIENKININTASIDQLTMLPGIGNTKAQRIISYRQQYGYFTSVDDLAKVPGFSQSSVEALKGYITVGG